tara:strand:+ start:280 stop:1485 length:1206 start_codon:yes stop_codon:yes gene_type:complete
MASHDIKHTRVENTSLRQNRSIGWRYARRLMLSISLVAFSPEAIMTVSQEQIHWGDTVSAAERDAAYSPESDAFSDLEPLENDALEKQRGGFSIGGYEIDIGVSVSTTIEGFVEVSTNYSLSSDKGLVHIGSQVKNLAQDMAQNMAQNMATDIEAQAKDTVNDIQSEWQKEISLTGAATPEENGSGVVVAQADGLHVEPLVPPDSVSPLPGTGSTTVDSVINPVVPSPAEEIDSAQAKLTFPIPVEDRVSSPEQDMTFSQNKVEAVPSAGMEGAGPVKPTQPAPSNAAVVVPEPQEVSPETTVVAQGGGQDGAATITAGEGASFSITNGGEEAPESLASIIHQTKGDHITLLTNRLNNASIKQTVSMNITLENASRIAEIARLQKDLNLITRHISLYSLRR